MPLDENAVMHKLHCIQVKRAKKINTKSREKIVADWANATHHMQHSNSL